MFKRILGCVGLALASQAVADTDSVQVYTTQHFAIYWLSSGPNAPVARDQDGNGRPDYVDTAAADLEATYHMLADSLHYRLARGQTTTIYTRRQVPSGLYPVEILDLPTGNAKWRKTGTYGCIHDSLESPDGHGGTQIWLENDFLDGGKDSIVVGIRGQIFHNWVKDPYTALKFAVAHELYHAFTYEYERDWIYAFHEMAAVWFESWYAPETQNHWRYLPLFRDNLTASAFDNSSQQGYGNFVYLKAIVGLYGPHAIRKLWEDRAANVAGNDDTKWFRAAWSRLKIDTISRLTKYYGENSVRLVTGQGGAFDDGGSLIGKINPTMKTFSFFDFDTTQATAMFASLGEFSIGLVQIPKSSLPVPNWNVAGFVQYPQNGGDLYVVHYPSHLMDIVNSAAQEVVITFGPTDTMLVFADVTGDLTNSWGYYGTTRTSGLVPRPFQHNLPAFTRSMDILGRPTSSSRSGQIRIDLTSDGDGSRRRFGR